jgi:hypothetical protein
MDALFRFTECRHVRHDWQDSDGTHHSDPWIRSRGRIPSAYRFRRLENRNLSISPPRTWSELRSGRPPWRKHRSSMALSSTRTATSRRCRPPSSRSRHSAGQRVGRTITTSRRNCWGLAASRAPEAATSRDLRRSLLPTPVITASPAGVVTLWFGGCLLGAGDRLPSNVECRDMSWGAITDSPGRTRSPWLPVGQVRRVSRCLRR